MKFGIIFLFVAIFIGINTTVFYFSKHNTEQNIEIALKNSLETLNTHYNIGQPLKSGLVAYDPLEVGLLEVLISEYTQNDTHDILFQRCNQALYLAKSNGRNRVEAIHAPQNDQSNSELTNA